MQVKIQKRKKDGAYILRSQDGAIAAAWRREGLNKIVKHNGWKVVRSWG